MQYVFFKKKKKKKGSLRTSARKCYTTPAFSGIPKQRGTKLELAHKWAQMLHHPCILGEPQIKEDKIRIGPQAGGNATTPLHSRGSPKNGVQKRNWPTKGRKRYINPAFSGIPKQTGTESELAHKWAEMLQHPCILGNSQIKEDKIRTGPQVGGNATSPLHSRGSPNNGGQNQNWPTSGRKCYTTPAFSGVPQTTGDKIRIGPQVGGNATSP